MEDRDRDSICVNLTYLSDKTVWNPGLEHSLVANGVFSQRMLDDVTKSSTPVRTMYQKACKRGPKAFEGLVQSLVQSNNFVPAQRLKPTLQPIAPTHNSGGKVWNAPVYASQPSYTPVYPSPTNRFPHQYQPRVGDGSPTNIFKCKGGGGDPLAPDMVLRPPDQSDSSPVVTAVRQFTVRQFTVRPAKQITLKYPMCYPMTSRPRGQCLIINNEVFDHQKERRGSTADTANLTNLFTDLGFNVTLKTDLSGIDLKREVFQFSKSEEHATAQMCVLVVLSHGGNGFVFGCDGKRCENEWILKQFNNEGCPGLVGKPKFFIFQACRGDDEDKGVIESYVQKGPEMFVKYESTTETDACGFMPKRQPTWTDFLVAYATVPGYVANRDIYRGSWFVQSICKVFAGQAADKDIREMMDEVSQEMQNYQSEGPDGSMQSSTYEVRGSFKKLFFNPGLYTNEQAEVTAASNKIKEMNLGSQEQLQATTLLRYQH